MSVKTTSDPDPFAPRPLCARPILRNIRPAGSIVGTAWGTLQRGRKSFLLLQKESGANFILANDFLKGRPWHTEPSDAEKAKIAAALDHLRELGEVDLEFKGLGKREKP